MNNRDREVYLAFLRKTEEHKREPSWMREDDGLRSFTRIIIGASTAAIVGLCAYGIWQHEQVKPWAVQVAEECERSGKTPHVERDRDGKVLGVRCDIK